jgi:putative sterol carrier protein
MTIELTIENITAKVAEVALTMPATGKLVRMEIGLALPIVYDGTVTPPTVDNTDRAGQATISMDYATFIALSEGKTSGPAAMMMGKLKIKGDISAAMSFQQIMNKVQQFYRST